MALETLKLNLVYVLNKAVDILVRVLSFSFFFVISAGFFHPEPLYFLCRFRYQPTVNKTACSILWHLLSKFVLSLGFGFEFETPKGSEFLGSEFFWVWGLSFWDTQKIDAPSHLAKNVHVSWIHFKFHFDKRGKMLLKVAFQLKLSCTSSVDLFVQKQPTQTFSSLYSYFWYNCFGGMVFSSAINPVLAMITGD